MNNKEELIYDVHKYKYSSQKKFLIFPFIVLLPNKKKILAALFGFVHNNTIVYIIKFVYSEKATKFCEISTLLLSTVQKLGGDFAKFCGLLRIYEL